MITMIDYPEDLCSNTEASVPRKPTVLFISDDPRLHTNLQIRLQAYDLELMHTFFGSEELTDPEEQLPDLIITDLATPSDGGRELLNLLKGSNIAQKVPVIVLGEACDSDLEQHLVHEGVSSFVQKPLRFSELLPQLRDHICLSPRNFYHTSA